MGILNGVHLPLKHVDGVEPSVIEDVEQMHLKWEPRQRETDENARGAGVRSEGAKESRELRW